MEIIAGIDIGNSTTEIAIAQVGDDGSTGYLYTGIAETTGIKGTVDNVTGISAHLNRIQREQGIRPDKILLNDATPVIADFAMDTITETVITDSAMIGHNPDTPGGAGFGTGITARIDGLADTAGQPCVAVIPAETDFRRAAELINAFEAAGGVVAGAIVQKDEGTLISNRLTHVIPIVDEVLNIEEVPIGMKCAVEVADKGRSIEMLSNPYGIATVFDLDAEETDYCRYVAKALIGNRSAVIIKTPSADIKKRTIPAGTIEIIGRNYRESVDADEGAGAIMWIVEQMDTIDDVRGSNGTNTGGMFEKIKLTMAEQCGMLKDEIRISDLFAADSVSAVPVKGGLAGERAMEAGVAIAAMVKTDRSFMGAVADALRAETGIPVEVGGIEAEMACRGVLTTPGTDRPLIMVDIGAGSTDVAYIDESGEIRSTHLAGAGDLVTTVIDAELGLGSFETAEVIKKYPLAKVDNLFRLRYETGDMEYFSEPLPAAYYGHTVAVMGRPKADGGNLYILDTAESIEKIRAVRRDVKKKVILANVNRAIGRAERFAEKGGRVVFVGGSILDFELGDLLTENLGRRRITAGRGNIRGTEGPRNAVATGLIETYVENHIADNSGGSDE
ncbi:MAG: diol dehydratase reactivase subunit alpha [Bacillota bacterium]|nr:diol dehydratase reactivase subunit alpha [Bacillota bacterium]